MTSCESIRGITYNYYDAATSTTLSNYCAHGGNQLSYSSIYNEPNCCTFDTIQVWMIVVMSVLGPAVVLAVLILVVRTCLKQIRLNKIRE